MLKDIGTIEKDTESMMQAARTAESQTNIAESIMNKIDSADIDNMISIEGASLDSVSQLGKDMNMSIVALISGLDSKTNEVGSQLDGMQQPKWHERVVGIFSKQKASEMREERIKSNDISDNLNEIINQSNQIKHILEKQRDVLRDKREIGLTTLEQTQSLLTTSVRERDDKEKHIRDNMMPVLNELEIRMNEAEDPVARVELEAEVAQERIKLNDAQNEIQVLVSQIQSLEKYANMHKTGVDSLSNQLNNQVLLIKKLSTDTKHRSVLYDQLENSLKTADQQAIAHALNDIGSKVDDQTQRSMAAIGAASNKRMVETAEGHAAYMQNSQTILAEKAKADAEFFARFGDVLEQQKSGNYGQ
ncbi:hypothetical protein LMH73_007545 [Vibrio splendidus]|nr:hypothetical protein [Vibrio splendidus]MCC4880383.1 hypothetical protein [Vibrio splendidus]